MKDFFANLNEELGLDNSNASAKTYRDIKWDTELQKIGFDNINKVDYREVHTPATLKDNMTNTFPETNFYLPRLRENSLRVIPVGGNNENGKNMFALQYGNEILLIDSGNQKAETTMLWAKYSIPDISFLIPVKNKIKWIILTSAKENNIGAIKETVSALWNINIYASEYTIKAVKRELQGIKQSPSFKKLESNKETSIGQFKIEPFTQNTSTTGSIGLVVSTSHSRLVYTSDFKIEVDENKKSELLTKLEKISEKEVTMLISDSYWSNKQHFNKSDKEIKESISQSFTTNNKGKTIAVLEPSAISRISAIIDFARENEKTVMMASKELIEYYKDAEDLGIINGKGVVKRINPNTIKNIPSQKQIILMSGNLTDEYSNFNKVVNGTNNLIELEKWDNVIIQYSEVKEWNREIQNILNKLILNGINVSVNEHLDSEIACHPSKEEQKVIINILKPKFVLPARWDLIKRTIHKKTIMENGYYEYNVVMLNNGEIVDLDQNQWIFRSRIKAPIQDIIIDGHGLWIAGSHVIKARRKMMNSWVLVIVFNVDAQTKTIVWPIRLETRGLVYLEEVRQIHRVMIKKARAIYENTIMDVPEIENKDLTKIIKTDLESYLHKALDREPMVIPIVLSN